MPLPPEYREPGTDLPSHVEKIAQLTEQLAVLGEQVAALSREKSQVEGENARLWAEIKDLQVVSARLTKENLKVKAENEQLLVEKAYLFAATRCPRCAKRENALLREWLSTAIDRLDEIAAGMRRGYPPLDANRIQLFPPKELLDAEGRI